MSNALDVGSLSTPPSRLSASPTTPPALLPLLHQDATTRLCHRPLSPPPLRREAGLPLCLAILTLSAATSGHRRRTSAPVDVWGLGLVLYQATKIRHSTFCTARLRPTFTRRPCRAGSFGWPDPHPESERRRLPPGVADIIDACLHQDPDQRPTPERLAAALAMLTCARNTTGDDTPTNGNGSAAPEAALIRRCGDWLRRSVTAVCPGAMSRWRVTWEDAQLHRTLLSTSQTLA